MTVKRGEIYFVNLNPVQGKEQAGKRPVLVLSIDAINQLPLVITVVVGTRENITCSGIYSDSERFYDKHDRFIRKNLLFC